MFAMRSAQRWYPNWSLLGMLLASSLFFVACALAVAALRGPRLLGYELTPATQPHVWRVTTVWPSSFAWDAGLRPGMLIQGTTPPAARDSTIVRVRGVHCCHPVIIPPLGDSAPSLAWLELPLAALILTIGLGTWLFARARGPAFLLALFCFIAAIGLCGAAAFAHGAQWGSVLFETCWFALLPALMLPLATSVPTGGRTVALGWGLPVLLCAGIAILEGIGFADIALYTPTRDVEGVVFVVTQAVAIGIWCWRASAARTRPDWPEYRLVLLGLGGSFGGFALLAVVPTILRWRLPWPPEANIFVLLLFPGSLSWALVRHRLLDLRRTVTRTAITVVLLTAALSLGLAMVAAGMSVVGLSLAVLLAGVGLPVAQRAIDNLLPDSRRTYANLVQRSGEQLSLVVEPEFLGPIMEEIRRGLGLASVCLRRDGTVLVQAGTARFPPLHRFVVRHDGDALATLDIGEKLHHDALLAADQEALDVFCNQLGAFLTRWQLLLQLRDTVIRLEELQQRLLTARRRERERLGQRLHRGPLQDIVLLRRMLTAESSLALAALQLETSLRAILTETTSTLLRDFGLPAALRAYMAYLTPYASEQHCVIDMELDDAASELADDEAFVLYQLAHEALTNIIRHSGCQQVHLRLQVDRDQVVLQVRDDGRGLPQGWDQVRVDHRGLRDALELVQTVRGGAATAEALATGGTMVRARVPWCPRAERRKEEQLVQREDTISVLIAEDHAVMRQGLRRLLAEDERLVVVAEARTGYEILGLVMQHQPDIVLLDIDLPGQNGLAALRGVYLHIAHPPRVLVLSAFCDEEYVCRAHELGVAGFLSKDCDGEHLRDAIHRTVAGEQVLDAAVEAIVKKQSYSAKGRFQRYSDGSEALTRAELDVLRHMLEGESYEEIAVASGREHGTVRSQVASVIDKLGVSSRGQAVRKAL